jgi:hypothetical protein
MTGQVTARRPEHGLVALFLDGVRHSCWLLGISTPNLPPQPIRYAGNTDRRKGGRRG